MKFRSLISPTLCFKALLILSLTIVPAHAQQPQRSRTVRNRTQPPSTRVHFLSGESALGIPFEISGNLILLQARVNDSAPGWFILDTGADSTVIDAQLAKTLRLKPHSKTVGTGSAGTAEAIIFKAVTLRFSSVEAVNQTVAALPLDFLSSPLGIKISGVIGNDIIKEFVLEVDYASRIINLYQPASYRYSGTGEIIPITLEENLPFVRTSIAVEGKIVGGKFELDTGSTGTVSFNTPFVRKHRLLKAVSKTNQTRLGGVGGTAQAYLGRVKRILLGQIAIESPVARFSQATRGDYANAQYDGLIGGEIFRRFKTIFDYSRRRMILEPNAQFTESYEVDMSGLKLVADGDDYSTVLVDDVEAGSAAGRAGIQGGDIITAIDGRPSTEFKLDQIRRMFMQDGRAYLLTLRRGEQTVQAKVKLRRLV